jgi:hypothetical protein
LKFKKTRVKNRKRGKLTRCKVIEQVKKFYHMTLHTLLNRLTPKVSEFEQLWTEVVFGQGEGLQALQPFPPVGNRLLCPVSSFKGVPLVDTFVLPDVKTKETKNECFSGSRTFLVGDHIGFVFGADLKIVSRSIVFEY